MKRGSKWQIMSRWTALLCFALAGNIQESSTISLTNSQPTEPCSALSPRPVAGWRNFDETDQLFFDLLRRIFRRELDFYVLEDGHDLKRVSETIKSMGENGMMFVRDGNEAIVRLLVKGYGVFVFPFMWREYHIFMRRPVEASA